MRKERKHYTAEEKVAILRRHLLDKVPISDLCEEHGLQPTVFHRWQKELFENGAATFQGKSRPDHQGEQQRIKFPEKKIQTERLRPSLTRKGRKPSTFNSPVECRAKRRTSHSPSESDTLRP